MRFLLLAVSFIVFASATVEAQIDPSSAMLLNSGSRPAVRDSGIDSGRYTVRPRSESSHREDRTRTKSATVTNTSTTTVTTPSQAPSPTAAAGATSSATSTAAPSSQVGPTTDTFTDDDARSLDDDDSTEEPAVEKVPVDDRRTTMLEISLAPGYLYNESKSTFAPRNYFVNSPTMSIDAKVWVAPSFGVHTGFTGTVNANVTDSLDNTRNSIASNQWFTVGAHHRSFFGQGPLAPALQLGLDYREFEFRVPSDSKLRNKLATSGLFLLLDADVPTSNFGSWNFGAEFGPKLKHRETSGATDFRTGDDVQTATVGLHFGARYRFDRAQSLFWKISYGAEKNLFSGSTSIPDPVSGSAQTNVSVTNTFTLFQFGYTWSD